MYQVYVWILGFIVFEEVQKYCNMVICIFDVLDFMNVVGVDSNIVYMLYFVDFYISYEGLLLEYEEVLICLDFIFGNWFVGFGYMLWIGDCICQFDGVYVEFLWGVQNLIGLKCGLIIMVEDFKVLMEKLNLENEVGCLIFIVCFGVGFVGDYLLCLIKVVKEEGVNVVWFCDLMYGNMIKLVIGYKIWFFDSVLCEVCEFFGVYGVEGIIPGGVYFEMIG